MRSGFPHSLSSREISLSCCPLDQLAPASVDTGLAFAPSRLETLRDCFRLLEVFGRGAPEEQAPRDFANGERSLQFAGHTKDAVLHRGGACPLRNGDAGSGVVERLDFSL